MIPGDPSIATPDLFSYLQAAVDRDATPGRFILTGSQNFPLMEKVSQSPAGRTGHVIDLLLDEGGKLFPVEIKSGQTVSPNMFNSLSSATLVYGGTDFQTRHETALRPWFSL